MLEKERETMVVYSKLKPWLLSLMKRTVNERPVMTVLKWKEARRERKFMSYGRYSKEGEGER